MQLAHALSGTGVHSEYLVLGGAFLVLGVVLFIQKTVKPVISIAIILVAVALGTGAFVFAKSSPSSEGRQVTILAPKPGDPVEANEEFEVETVVSGADLASCDTCTDGGHLHVYVDDKTVAMTTQKQPRVKVRAGSHELAVELVDEQHLAYDPPVRDTTEVVAQ
jgi:hypothetical protein